MALKCFRAARDIYDTIEDQDIVELKDDLLGRHGNSLNTTATFYIKKATSFLESKYSGSQKLEKADEAHRGQINALIENQHDLIYIFNFLIT